MLSPSSVSSDTVLDEIRSTIASFESLRSAASARRRGTVAAGQPTTTVPAATALPTAVTGDVPVATPAKSSVAAKTTSDATVESSSVMNESKVLTSAVQNHFPKVPRMESAQPVTQERVRSTPERIEAVEAIKPATAKSNEPGNAQRIVGRPLKTALSEFRQTNQFFEATEVTEELSVPAFDLTEDEETTPASQPPETNETATKAKAAPTVWFRTVDKTAKIMIVDDEPLNVMTFRQHLKMEGYENFVTTSDAREALQLLRSELPDVVLLDIRMPEISGMDILRVIGLDPVLQHVPVLILTAATDPETRKQALDLGASDFLQKPIEPNELLPRVRNAIVIKKHYDMAASEAARLEQQVERRTRQLEVTRQQLILCLARAAEHRDNDTGNHVIRVGRYTSIIAKAMGYPEHKLEMLEQAAQLHDVGKIGIPDSILFKPGKLHKDEYDLMKRHCALGKQIIEPISEKEWNILKTHTRIGESMLHVRSSSLLMLAARIAQTHHEHWNGNGYPLGLKGEDIPLEGRIVAVADVFDALSSRRPYKEPFPRQKCFDIMAEGRGNQFDPRVIDAFFECAAEIVEVQLQLMDEEDRIPKGKWESVAAEALDRIARDGD